MGEVQDIDCFFIKTGLPEAAPVHTGAEDELHVYAEMQRWDFLYRLDHGSGQASRGAQQRHGSQIYPGQRACGTGLLGKL